MDTQTPHQAVAGHTGKAADLIAGLTASAVVLPKAMA